MSGSTDPVKHFREASSTEMWANKASQAHQHRAPTSPKRRGRPQFGFSHDDQPTGMSSQDAAQQGDGTRRGRTQIVSASAPRQDREAELADEM